MARRRRRGIALRLGVGAVAIASLSGCTHTRRFEPGAISPAFVSAERAVSGKRVLVRTGTGPQENIERAVLTPDSLVGSVVGRDERFSLPLIAVEDVRYRSRARGAYDWARLGALAGLIVTPFLLERECEGCSGYGILLAPLGLVVGGIYGAIVGVAVGSTIRFQVSPGR